MREISGTRLIFYAAWIALVCGLVNAAVVLMEMIPILTTPITPEIVEASGGALSLEGNNTPTLLLTVLSSVLLFAGLQLYAALVFFTGAKRLGHGISVIVLGVLLVGWSVWTMWGSLAELNWTFIFPVAQIFAGIIAVIGGIKNKRVPVKPTIRAPRLR